jgi:hypothetical protein
MSCIMCLCISRAKVYLVICKNACHGCVYSRMLLVDLFIITIWGLDVLFIYCSLSLKTHDLYMLYKQIIIYTLLKMNNVYSSQI